MQNIRNDAISISILFQFMLIKTYIPAAGVAAGVPPAAAAAAGAATAPPAGTEANLERPVVKINPNLRQL